MPALCVPGKNSDRKEAEDFTDQRAWRKDQIKLEKLHFRCECLGVRAGTAINIALPFRETVPLQFRLLKYSAPSRPKVPMSRALPV